MSLMEPDFESLRRVKAPFTKHLDKLRQVAQEELIRFHEEKGARRREAAEEEACLPLEPPQLTRQDGAYRIESPKKKKDKNKNKKEAEEKSQARHLRFLMVVQRLGGLLEQVERLALALDSIDQVDESQKPK